MPQRLQIKDLPFSLDIPPPPHVIPYPMAKRSRGTVLSSTKHWYLRMNTHRMKAAHILVAAGARTGLPSYFVPQEIKDHFQQRKTLRIMCMAPAVALRSRFDRNVQSLICRVGWEQRWDINPHFFCSFSFCSVSSRSRSARSNSSMSSNSILRSRLGRHSPQ